MFYVVENGNLQKKMQPYAADKVQRFQELAIAHKNSATQNIGPDRYNVLKPVPPPADMPVS